MSHPPFPCENETINKIGHRILEQLYLCPDAPADIDALIAAIGMPVATSGMPKCREVVGGVLNLLQLNGLVTVEPVSEPAYVAVSADRLDLGTVAYDPATNPYTELFATEGLKLCRPGKPPQRPTDGPGPAPVGVRTSETAVDASGGGDG